MGGPAARHTVGRQRRGSALVLSLTLVTVIAILGMGFVQLASTEARTQAHSVDQMRAFYLAESGLAEAYNAVRMGRSGQIGSMLELLQGKQMI